MGDIIELKPKTKTEDMTEGELKMLATFQNIVCEAILEMVEDYWDNDEIYVGDIREYARKIKRGE
jgi:hypothetical protein